MDTSLTFMKMVNCSKVEDWTVREHGLPVAAVFGTKGRYPRAVHIVSCQTIMDMGDSERESMKNMGIPEVEISNAFKASVDIILGRIASVDPDTWEHAESKFPAISNLDVLPEGRTVGDFLFMRAAPEVIAA